LNSGDIKKTIENEALDAQTEFEKELIRLNLSNNNLNTKTINQNPSVVNNMSNDIDKQINSAENSVFQTEQERERERAFIETRRI